MVHPITFVHPAHAFKTADCRSHVIHRLAHVCCASNAFAHSSAAASLKIHASVLILSQTFLTADVIVSRSDAIDY